MNSTQRSLPAMLITDETSRNTMASKIRSQHVRMFVSSELTLEDGLKLMPGIYIGTRKEVEFENGNGTSRSGPTYLLKLTIDQISKLGNSTKRHLVSAEYDVTRHVMIG